MPKKTKKFTGRTHIGFVLDRSGSMTPLASDVIGGYNQWLTGTQNEDGEVLFTLVKFDHEFELPYIAKPIKHVPPLTVATYVPRGSTALFDAIARCISQVFAQMSPGDRALIITQTDGLENASQEILSKDQLKKLISDHEALGNWTFAYQGANQDAFAEGGKIGMRTNSTQNFAATSQGVAKAYRSTSEATSRYLGGATGQSASFYGGEEDEGDPVPAEDSAMEQQARATIKREAK